MGLELLFLTDRESQNLTDRNVAALGQVELDDNNSFI
jgi:hypothetical protein